MNENSKLVILGGGAVGAPLAVYLKKAGRSVTLLRWQPQAKVSMPSTACSETRWTLQGDTGKWEVSFEEVCFSDWRGDADCLVIATKAHANEVLAHRLKTMGYRGNLVLLQNGLGVERPFLKTGFQSVVRGVLYLTSQSHGERELSIHVPRPSVMGLLEGDLESAQRAVEALSTPELPFEVASDLERAIWKKTIINAVFNSICTLTEQPNHLFSRDPEALDLAQRVVEECVGLAQHRGHNIGLQEIMEQILNISQHSSQWISTLQDVKAGRPTEIDFMNLELSRIAATSHPPRALPLTQALGELVKMKAKGSSELTSSWVPSALFPADAKAINE